MATFNVRALNRIGQNLLGNSLKAPDKPIRKIIDSQLDIKLGQFTPEELNAVLI